MSKPYTRKWRRVSFAADCIGGTDDEPGEQCSICGLTYADDCKCPGPTEEEKYDYREFRGVMYARRKRKESK